MSFELFPGLAPWLYAFVTLGVILSVVAIIGLSIAVFDNRRIRIARSESVRTYYGRAILSH